jgi:cytochrome c-type biogenesis protein CcmH/NrfF
MESVQPVPELCVECRYKVPEGPTDSADRVTSSDVACRKYGEFILAEAAKMIQVLRWLLLLGFVAWGLYMGLWAFQSASFSVPADPPMKAVYETRAMLALPVGALLIGVGVLAFVLLGRRDR